LIVPIFKQTFIFRVARTRARFRRISGLLALALVVLLQQQRGSAATHDIQIEDFEFIPKKLVIAPGDTVIWHANAQDHTVTADDLSFDSSPPPDVVTIPPGSTFSHTFANIGVNHYYCRLHGRPVTSAAPASRKGAVNSSPDDAMMAVIRVADPSVNSPPTKPFNSTPAAGATGISNSPLLQATAFSDADDDDEHASSQWLVKRVGSGEVIVDSGEDTMNLTQLRVSGLSAATTYEWQVRYRDDRGLWSDYSSPTSFTVADATGVGAGLKGTYFAYDARRDIITKQVAVRVDPALDFEWKLGKPHPAAPANNFFIYWEGSLLPEFSEQYRIRVHADGGVRLWINGQIIIDDPVAASFALYRSGTVNLEAGIPAPIRIQYFDTKGNASMHLRWSSPSRPLQVIPQTRLIPE
jgi:plastocyanin